MGHPAPSTGRRSAASTAGSPRCNACGCRPNAAAAACLPAAAASLFGATSVRDTQIHRTASVRRSANGKGGLDPGRRDSRATTVWLERPAVAKSSARYRKGSRRPSAVLGAPPSLHNQRHGARCLWRCISPPATVFSQRGTSVAVFRARAGFPRQTLDCSSAPGSPDYRVSPANAVSLRQRRIASTRPGCPGLPGGPGEAVT